MFKYMKYEIKGTYKFIAGIILAVIIATTTLQFTIFNGLESIQNGNNPNNYIGNTIFPIVMLITMFIIMGSVIALLIYIVSSFRKELSEDRGYLTFTLPITGKEILGSKLLISLLYLTIYGVVIFAYNAILALILFKDQIALLNNYITNQTNFIISFIIEAIISVGLTLFISVTVTLLLIYLAITLSKVTLGNRKIGGLWFIIFLILDSLYSYISFNISKIFPYVMSLEDLKIYNINEITKQFSYSDFNIVTSIVTIGDNLVSYISVASISFSILAGIGIFILTSNLLERKIDL